MSEVRAGTNLSVETELATSCFAAEEVAQRRLLYRRVGSAKHDLGVARIGTGTTSSRTSIALKEDPALAAAVGDSLAASPTQVDEDSNPRITC